MQVSVNVPRQLAELEQASQLPAKQNSESAREAVEYILNFRKTYALDGLKIKDPINEGR
jgi:hypothetical protein